MTETETGSTDGITAIRLLRNAPGPQDLGEAYGAMIQEARRFVDQLAAARIDVETAENLQRTFESLSEQLRPFEAGADERLFGRWIDRPGRGQFLVPLVQVINQSDDQLEGRVAFGPFYLGGNDAVHGGAMALVFDDSLGYLSNSGGRIPSRTAYLKVDYRAIAVMGREFELHCWVERVDGRKRFMRAEIRQAGTVCAEASGLWVELRPGQP